MHKTPSFLEDHISQIPAIQLLINMGYTYVPPSEAEEWRGGKRSAVLFENIIKEQLGRINTIKRKGKEYPFSDSNISSAVLALKDLPLQDGFINANAALYDLLTLGKSFEQTIDGDKKSHTLQYIDWNNWENNVFHVTEEFSVIRTGRVDSYRPDVLLFINGIPLVIIECKSPALTGTKKPTELAIEQHIRNFSKDGIRALYVYSSLLISVAENDGKYATTGTSKEFWSKWKEQFQNSTSESDYNELLKRIKNTPLDKAVKKQIFGERSYGYSYAKPRFDKYEKEERLVTAQDKMLYSLCQPKRLLDIIRNFTIYDKGVKKVARYQQYFAVNATINRVQNLDITGKRQGGVIWHTQGSGKSLTMVMLAQMLASNKSISNPKIVLITDRKDLDKQISETFKKCKKDVVRARTGSHLIEQLTDSSDDIITAVINKFEAAVKKLSPLTSADIFVLIDEGHRTQYGTFNVSMRRVFPNACFIAFTGTPLMKKEKSTAQKFGGYIGLPYTVLDAVADGAVLPLLYEGRHNNITLNEKPINDYFDKVSEPLSDYGKAQLKRKFNTINELNKTDQIIKARAWDICEHYTGFFQTQQDKYKPKAQIVAPTIKAALKYHYYIEEIGKIRKDLKVSTTVIVTRGDQREGHEDGFYENDEEKEREDKYFEAMIDKYGDLSKFEENSITQFKEDEHPEIIIVVAKLLTGFDAPNNTVLYLCRSLKEHTLLQAIARVNRVHPGKDYGYIIDYFGNLESLDEALSTYSGLNNFDEDDLKGSITNIAEEIKKLPQAHADVWEIFKELKDKTVEASVYQEHLSQEDVRHKFYEKLCVFTRLLKMALSSVQFINNTSEEKVNTYKRDAKVFLKLRQAVKIRFNDELSYREYEPHIQKLINQHISTEGEILKVTEMVNIFDKEEREAEVEKITGTAAQADHISSRTIKAINVKMREDPIYYKKLAELIKETISDYYQKRISEAEYLRKAKQHEDDFFNGRSNNAPPELAGNEVALAFYNFSKSIFDDEALLKTPFHIETSLMIDEVVKNNVYVDGKNIIDWISDDDITGKINIQLGDKLYELHQKFDLDTDWTKIDELIEEGLKVVKLKYS